MEADAPVVARRSWFSWAAPEALGVQWIGVVLVGLWLAQLVRDASVSPAHLSVWTGVVLGIAIALFVSCRPSLAEMRETAKRMAALEHELRARQLAQIEAGNSSSRKDGTAAAAPDCTVLMDAPGCVVQFNSVSENLASLTAAVGLGLTRVSGLREMLQECADAFVQHLHAAQARIWTLDESGQILELQASAGNHVGLGDVDRLVPLGHSVIGTIAAERKALLNDDRPIDPETGDLAWARREALKTFAGYPLLLDSKLLGVMAIHARDPLSPSALHAMSILADGIALGIERKRAEYELIGARVSSKHLRIRREATPGSRRSS